MTMIAGNILYVNGLTIKHCKIRLNRNALATIWSFIYRHKNEYIMLIQCYLFNFFWNTHVNKTIIKKTTYSVSYYYSCHSIRYWC